MTFCTGFCLNRGTRAGIIELTLRSTPLKQTKNKQELVYYRLKLSRVETLSSEWSFGLIFPIYNEMLFDQYFASDLKNTAILQVQNSRIIKKLASEFAKVPTILPCTQSPDLSAWNPGLQTHSPAHILLMSPSIWQLASPKHVSENEKIRRVKKNH